MKFLYVLFVVNTALSFHNKVLPRQHFLQREDSPSCTSILASTTPHSSEYIKSSSQIWQRFRRSAASIILLPLFLLGGQQRISADDELAKFAAEGNVVAVDGQCFLKKCSLETSKCASDQTCLKGLSCLARCKGASMCSTGCFAKYGSDKLDGLLSCTVEKNDCVHVPGKENKGWSSDKVADLPSKPLKNFDISQMQGSWYKVMGLDSRYDCFDCQKNTFTKIDDKSVKMEALFRIPRPTFPGYLQNTIVEELHVSDEPSGGGGNSQRPTLQSKGEMFGLTFWENWYVLQDRVLNFDSNPLEGMGIPSANAVMNKVPEMQLVFYTGHTLQGSYKGAFLYSRSPVMTPEAIRASRDIIQRAGLDPNKFCMIRNQCFLSNESEDKLEHDRLARNQEEPFWFLGQKFFKATEAVATELSDWFGDPAYLSDWLMSQQEHMVVEQPLVRRRSPWFLFSSEVMI